MIFCRRLRDLSESISEALDVPPAFFRRKTPNNASRRTRGPNGFRTVGTSGSDGERAELSRASAPA